MIAPRLEFEQELQAQTGRVVRTRAERLARVDHDIADPGRGRRVPRGADVQARGAAAELDGPVEVAPALADVVGDLGGDDLDERRADGRLQIGQPRQLARRAVHRVFDALAPVDLLDAARGEGEQLGQGDLRVLAPDADRQADHWENNRRSLATTDSSEPRFSSVIESAISRRSFF